MQWERSSLQTPSLEEQLPREKPLFSLCPWRLLGPSHLLLSFPVCTACLLQIPENLHQTPRSICLQRFEVFHMQICFSHLLIRCFLIDNIITKVGVFYPSLWRFSWPCQPRRECILPLEKRTSSNAGGSLGIIPVQLERKHIQREHLMKTYALSFQEQRPHVGTWTRQFMHHNYTRQLAYTWKHAS